MRNIVSYEPWGSFSKLHDEINRLFDGEAQDPSKVVTSNWTPAVDIREEKDAFVLQADIPGVDPKDIEITMENGVLTVKGERRIEKESEEDTFKRVERAYGVFYRRFSLPETANPDAITASGNHGVLKVRIPKQELAQPRRISVS
ncbi:MAG: Hsp20/alpha crystallin family protein [Gammaproteobacteria bacterium]|nr:Hsp20/alpha crystallin family protein [Gammaproteobacteria bacterium]